MPPRKSAPRRSARQHAPQPGGRLKWILLGCFLLGAGIFWVGKIALPRLPVHFASAVVPGGHSPDALKNLSRERLESEVLRLQALVDARDKEIADLMIRIRLAEAGSSGTMD